MLTARSLVPEDLQIERLCRHRVTLPDALAALSRLCLLHYPVDEKTTVTKLPHPDANQKQILAALGVTLPAT